MNIGCCISTGIWLGCLLFSFWVLVEQDGLQLMNQDAHTVISHGGKCMREITYKYTHTCALTHTHTHTHTHTLGNQCFPICGTSIKAGMNSEGTKHKLNEAPFYFSERQTMPRCFGQYVQQQLSANKRLYNSLDSISPWREFLHSEYLFFEHTATLTTTTTSLFAINCQQINRKALV